MPNDRINDLYNALLRHEDWLQEFIDMPTKDLLPFDLGHYTYIERYFLQKALPRLRIHQLIQELLETQEVSYAQLIREELARRKM